MWIWSAAILVAPPARSPKQCSNARRTGDPGIGEATVQRLYLAGIDTATLREADPRRLIDHRHAEPDSTTTLAI